MGWSIAEGVAKLTKLVPNDLEQSPLAKQYGDTISST
jgi:hypothetical protein